MNEQVKINLHFDDYEKGCYLIKFGKKEHLEEIRDGKVRFSRLEKYQDIENKNIGDKNEGLESVSYTDKNTQFTFFHPNINNGAEINISQSIISMYNYPNTNKYISCFSYFTAKDIDENTIFDSKILDEPEWDSVLFILDTTGFVNNIHKALHKEFCMLKPVQYLDYTMEHSELDEFSKSIEFQHQKEIRFSFSMINENNKSIHRINKDTVEVYFDKVQSVIIPTKDFREGFMYKIK